MDGVSEFFVPQEYLPQLIVLMIERNSPPYYMSCDWIRDPLSLGLSISFSARSN